MTGNSSADAREAFEKSLLECVEDINNVLPGLSRRYDMTVIIGALAEHVGCALRVLMHENICDARQARLAITHMEGSAFVRKTAQLKPQGPPAAAGGPPRVTPAAGRPAPVGRPPENPTRH
ncbi:MAG: hypothetical protein ACRETD_08770 [Steroidobacteraceae bacterium]